MVKKVPIFSSKGIMKNEKVKKSKKLKGKIKHDWSKSKNETEGENCLLNSKKDFDKKKKKIKKSVLLNENNFDDSMPENNEDVKTNDTDITQNVVKEIMEPMSEESDGSFNIDSYPSDSDDELDVNQRKRKKLKVKKSKKSSVEDSSSSDDSDSFSDSNSVSSFNIDSYPSEDSDEEAKQRGKPIHSVQSKELDELESRTIFVGNLPNSIETIELKKWFSRFGAIESIRLRCAAVPEPSISKKVAVIRKQFHNERSNISAFVRFRNIKSVENALQANGAVINDYTIRVDHAVHKTPYDAKKSIFIGNVPFNAEEEPLRQMFSDCGDIESVRIVRDKATGMGKGFAYINFKSSTSIPLALKLDKQEFGKRELRVSIVKNMKKLKVLKKKGKPQKNVKKNKFFKKDDAKGSKTAGASKNKRNVIKHKKEFIDNNKDIKNINKKKMNQFQGEVGQRRTKKYNKRKFIQKMRKEQLSTILTKTKTTAN